MRQPAEPAALERTPRSQRSHDAVLRATAQLLVSGGVGAATVDAISARSGVSKATIYKHWPNRVAVAADAFAEHMATEVPLPDTGTTRGDLAEQLRRVCAFYAGPAGTVYAQLLALASGDDQAGALLRERFLTGRRLAIHTLWQRGIERGEVRGKLDVDAVIDVLFGPVIFRLVSGHAPITPDQADLIADAALNGVLGHR